MTAFAGGGYPENGDAGTVYKEYNQLYLHQQSGDYLTRVITELLIAGDGVPQNRMSQSILTPALLEVQASQAKFFNIFNTAGASDVVFAEGVKLRTDLYSGDGTSKITLQSGGLAHLNACVKGSCDSSFHVAANAKLQFDSKVRVTEVVEVSGGEVHAKHLLVLAGTSEWPSGDFKHNTLAETSTLTVPNLGLGPSASLKVSKEAVMASATHTLTAQDFDALFNGVGTAPSPKQRLSDPVRYQFDLLSLGEDAHLEFQGVEDVTIVAKTLNIAGRGSISTTAMQKTLFLYALRMRMDSRSTLNTDQSGASTTVTIVDPVAGASHGGLGGCEDRKGAAYGSVFDADEGGRSAGGTRGGGVIALTVRDQLELYGDISAAGGPGSSASGGSSGGSILISATILQGDGIIRVDGGVSQSGGGGGGGRVAIFAKDLNRFAGRYSAYGGAGGSGNSAFCSHSTGGAGTVLLRTLVAGLKAESLIAANNPLFVGASKRRTQTIVGHGTTAEFKLDVLEITGNTWVSFKEQAAARVIVDTRRLVGDRSGLIQVLSDQTVRIEYSAAAQSKPLALLSAVRVDELGEVVFPARVHLVSPAHANDLTLDVGGLLTGAGELAVASGAKARFAPTASMAAGRGGSGGADPSQYIFRSIPGHFQFLVALLLSKGSQAEFSSGASSSPCNQLQTSQTCGTVTVKATEVRLTSGSKLIAGDLRLIATSRVEIGLGALLTADGFGDASGIGDGAGTAMASASHGGYGALTAEATNCTTDCLVSLFGSYPTPAEFGSGGYNGSYSADSGGYNGSYSAEGVGGAGGGRVYIKTPSLHVDGTISAAGTEGATAFPSSSCGSGGSILIQVSKLFTGIGTISADGGGRMIGDPSSSSNSTAGGGGGRVAVEIDSTSGFQGHLRANGGGGNARFPPPPPPPPTQFEVFPDNEFCPAPYSDLDVEECRAFSQAQADGATSEALGGYSFENERWANGAVPESSWSSTAKGCVVRKADTGRNVFWNTATSSNWSPGIYQLVCKGNSDTAATSPVSPIGKDGGHGTGLLRELRGGYAYTTMYMSNGRTTGAPATELGVAGDELAFDELHLVDGAKFHLTSNLTVSSQLVSDTSAELRVDTNAYASLEESSADFFHPSCSFILAADGELRLPRNVEFLGLHDRLHGLLTGVQTLVVPANTKTSFGTTGFTAFRIDGAYLTPRAEPGEYSFGTLHLQKSSLAEFEGTFNHTAKLSVGTLRLAFNSTLRAAHMIITAGQLLVESSASVDLSAGGHAADTGPGHGQGFGRYLVDQPSSTNPSNASATVVEGGLGAGHGGCGGGGLHHGLRACIAGSWYGSAVWPIDGGSGGASFNGSAGGAGGGHLDLTVTSMRLFGGLNVAGGNAVGHAGGGSGGAVLINVVSLLGTGSINANGGDAAVGGAGSGGRVTVYMDTKNELFGGTVTARGGSGPRVGAAGTFYLLDDRKGIEKSALTINNGGNGQFSSVVTERSDAVSLTPLTMIFEEPHAHSDQPLYFFDVLDIRGGTNAEFGGANATLMRVNRVDGDGTAHLRIHEDQVLFAEVIKGVTTAMVTDVHFTVHPGGEMVLPAHTTVATGSVQINGTLTNVVTLDILGGGDIRFGINVSTAFLEKVDFTAGRVYSRPADQDYSNRLFGKLEFGDLIARAESTVQKDGPLDFKGATLQVKVGARLQHSQYNLDVGLFSVEPGAVVSTSGEALEAKPASTLFSGAAHANKGGPYNVTDSEQGYGTQYGNLIAPVDYGSAALNGGAGGGIIRLITNDALVDGKVVCDGQSAVLPVNMASTARVGGGSGGSIHATINGGMHGTGIWSASGGDGVCGSAIDTFDCGVVGGGSGGRIAFDLQSEPLSFAGKISALGGGTSFGNRLPPPPPPPPPPSI